jgi:hypothetical protein
MNTTEWLDDIEDEIRMLPRKVNYTRFKLLDWASVELNRLSGSIDSDIFNIHLNPVISTADGERYYDLPDNFGINFIMGGGDYGEKFMCVLNNNDSESLLEFLPSSRFFGMSLASESESAPHYYTILSKPDGRKQLVTSPPADAVYAIDGVYRPTDWKLTEMSSLPPLPGNSAILKYAVLRRLDPIFNAQYGEAYRDLLMTVAKSNRSQIVPRIKE